MDKKENFLKIYKKLPNDIRKRVIYVFKDKEQKIVLTWEEAFLEVTKDTELGKQVLKKLIELDIL